MRIGITGATGFLARHLLLHAHQHERVAYSRSAQPWPVLLADEILRVPADAPHAVPETRLDALVHLAGESLMGFWTQSKKQRIWKSRVDLTASLIAQLRSWRAENRPRVLICASGAGFYGNRGEESLDEYAAAGEGFLAKLCVAWENAAQEAAALGIRVITLRTGMVLGEDGGAFPLLRRVFRLGLGGRLGSGQQWMPWIHVEDAARLILHALDTQSMHGPLNLVAPQAVTNAVFTQTLATVLHRPAFCHVPAAVLRGALPGMAEEMLLPSTRVLPRIATESGYTFAHPQLQGALTSLWQSGT
ncbi:MAG: TIGR01777 family protein [Verrucomicrobiaceae bacterium]|nr:TIGR01777 family protein [Verrucomicrobiaceae bacterium]